MRRVINGKLFDRVCVSITCAACCVLLIAAFAEVRGLDAKRGVTQYGQAVWQDRDGLPQNTVQAITQTRDGYLWMGTEVGLARFDGVRFVVFNHQNTPEIKNDNITSLCETTDGTLWAGTRGGGLLAFKDNRFTAYAVGQGLPNNSVRALATDARGRLWIGTNDGLALKIDDGFKTYKRFDGLPSNVVRSLIVDSANRLWMGTGNGLAWLDAHKINVNQISTAVNKHPNHNQNIGELSDAKIIEQVVDTALPRRIVRAITVDASGTMWFCVDRKGVWRWRDGIARQIIAPESLKEKDVRALLSDADGNLWIGTFGGGLFRLNENGISDFTTRENLSSDIVRALYEDRERSLWIGTEGGGLNRLTNGKVIVLGRKDGLAHDYIRAIKQDARGRVWIGTEGGGVTLWHDGKVRANLTTRENLSSNFITSLFEDGRGAMWIGTLDGLNKVETRDTSTDEINFTVKRYGEREGLPTSAVWAITADDNANIFIGTGSGVSRLRDNRIEFYEVGGEQIRDYVRVLHRGRDGSLWIGLREGGVVRVVDNRIINYQTARDLTDATVTAFYEDAAGTLWIATHSGLARFDNSEFRFITARDGLFSDNIYQILEDGDDVVNANQSRLWMSSPSGIFAVRKNQLADFFNNRLARVESQVYTAADGMRSSECSGDAQPAGTRTDDYRLWFPTVRGVVIINPRDMTRNTQPPPVTIEAISVGRESVTIKENLKLAPDAGEVAFRFAALSFVAPEKVQFKYKLEGLDKDWVDAENRREAFYTNLPPGTYNFKVIACNNDGVWNTQGASFGFQKLPRFYQTSWFALACLLMLIALAWSVYSFRVRQIKRRFALVTDERNRIAREWHDTLVAGIAAIAWQLETGTAKVKTAPDTAERHLHLARRMVRHSLTEARRALWDLRTLSAEDDLATALSNSLKRLTAGRDIATEINVTGTPSRLPAEVETNVLRIGQEAVSNAINHAAPHKIQVKIAFTPQHLALEVTDDGHGFDPHANHTAGAHFGLAGMRERARKIGAQLDLSSSPHQGTRINLELSLKAHTQT